MKQLNEIVADLMAKITEALNPLPVEAQLQVLEQLEPLISRKMETIYEQDGDGT